jgi:tRNA (Thr-GGU) A37 N-methylase
MPSHRERSWHIDIQPIGFVEAKRQDADDDFWGAEEACISLVPTFAADALLGVADFSHVEVLFLFHLVEASKIGRYLCAAREESTQPHRQYHLPRRPG